MSGLKTAGGSLALIGGILILLSVIMGYAGVGLYALVFPLMPANGILNLLLVVLALGGGILGLTKRFAGGLVLAAGIIFIIMEYCVTTFDPYTQSELILFLNPCSFFVGTFGISLGPFTFESVMVFVGGVLILSSGKDPIKSRRQVISCAVCGGVMSGQRCTSCRSVWCSNCEAWNHPQVSMDEAATKLEKCAVCGSVLSVGNHIRPEKCE